MGRVGLGLVTVAFVFVVSLQGADRSVDPIVSHIRREPVKSTAIDAIGYSKRLRALEIQFHDGLIYRYLEVPIATYRELMQADSRARYYNGHVRGKYRCLRVKPRRPQ